MNVKDVLSAIRYQPEYIPITIECTLPDDSVSECVIDRIYLEDEQYPTGKQRIVIEIHDKRCEEQDEE